MPWNPSDAPKHTKKARGNPKAQRAFAKAANSSLKRDGDEGKAVRIGNFAARKSKRTARRSSRK